MYQRYTQSRGLYFKSTFLASKRFPLHSQSVGAYCSNKKYQQNIYYTPYAQNKKFSFPKSRICSNADIFYFSSKKGGKKIRQCPKVVPSPFFHTPLFAQKQCKFFIMRDFVFFCTRVEYCVLHFLPQGRQKNPPVDYKQPPCDRKYRSVLHSREIFVW